MATFEFDKAEFEKFSKMTIDEKEKYIKALRKATKIQEERNKQEEKITKIGYDRWWRYDKSLTKAQNKELYLRNKINQSIVESEQAKLKIDEKIIESAEGILENKVKEHQLSTEERQLFRLSLNQLKHLQELISNDLASEEEKQQYVKDILALNKSNKNTLVKYNIGAGNFLKQKEDLEKKELQNKIRNIAYNEKIDKDTKKLLLLKYNKQLEDLKPKKPSSIVGGIGRALGLGGIMEGFKKGGVLGGLLGGFGQEGVAETFRERKEAKAERVQKEEEERLSITDKLEDLYLDDQEQLAQWEEFNFNQLESNDKIDVLIDLQHKIMQQDQDQWEADDEWRKDQAEKAKFDKKEKKIISKITPEKKEEKKSLSGLLGILGPIAGALLGLMGIFSSGQFKGALTLGGKLLASGGKIFKNLGLIPSQLKKITKLGKTKIGKTVSKIGTKVSKFTGKIGKKAVSIIKKSPKLSKFISKIPGIGKIVGKGVKGVSKSKGLFTGLLKATGSATKILKKIPLIGTIISIGSAISRFKSGDFLGGIIDVGSGIASLFPGIGTAISLGLDVFSALRDYSKSESGKKKVSSIGGNIKQFFVKIKDWLMNTFIFKKIFDLFGGIREVIFGDTKKGLSQIAGVFGFGEDVDELDKQMGEEKDKTAGNIKKKSPDDIKLENNLRSIGEKVKKDPKWLQGRGLLEKYIPSVRDEKVRKELESTYLNTIPKLDVSGNIIPNSSKDDIEALKMAGQTAVAQQTAISGGGNNVITVAPSSSSSITYGLVAPKEEKAK